MSVEAVSVGQSRSGLRELKDATPLLNDHLMLREQWEEDGVLLFRDAIDTDAITALREQFMKRLKMHRLVAPDSTEPVWTGLDTISASDAEAFDDSAWQILVAHPTFHNLVVKVIGEEPSWLPVVVYRCSAPTKEFAVVADPYRGRHQDGFFNNGIDFVTCWVPLMEIDKTIGGLAVAPGTHKAMLHDPSAPPMFKIPDDAIPEAAWCTPEYNPGDVLMFHSGTAHAGLPNQSNLFRLSIDLRFLPASAPKPIIGVIRAVDGSMVHIVDQSGRDISLLVDETSFLRGPKGARLAVDEYSEILYAGNLVLAVTDEEGQTRLLRSRNRRYLDLPPAWSMTPFPQ